MITAVILCHRRFENLELVLQSWLDQDEVTEVVVCDNSGTQWKTDLPVIVLNSNKNYGTYFRYAAPLLAKNELICWGDDDIVMEKGLTKDLLDIWKPLRLVGIMGKLFTGPKYYESTGIRGKKIDVPTKVDYLCGNCILGARHNFLQVDMMTDMPKYFWEGEQFLAMGDWWWEYRLEHLLGMTFWVPPTKKYTELPEQWDEKAYHKQRPVQLVREYYFRKWILGIEGEDISAVDPRLTSKI